MRETDQRFTFAYGEEAFPTWSPDGDRLLFVSLLDGSIDIYDKETAGTSPPQLVLENDIPTVLSDWSPDGEIVLYHTLGESFDLWLLPVSGDRQPTSFPSTPFQEAWGALSPDSRWLAYASDEAGEWRVYLRSVSEGGQWQISTGVGVRPKWRADGRELFYDTLEQEEIMAVEIDLTGSAPVIGTPQLLF